LYKSNPILEFLSFVVLITPVSSVRAGTFQTDRISVSLLSPLLSMKFSKSRYSRNIEARGRTDLP